MADLFIVKVRMKFSLTLITILVGLGLLSTWYFWSQLEFLEDRSSFLLSAVATGALAIGWLGFLIFYISIVRKDLSFNVTDRMDNVPWWIIKVSALLLFIGVMGFMLFRFSDRAENEFDLLRKGRLTTLEGRISTTPALLERLEYKGGETLAQVAYRENHPEAVRLLLALGAQADELDAKGRNPVSVSLGNLPMLGALLESGMNPDRPDAEGVPPVHRAVVLNAEDVVVLLLSAGTKIDSRDRIFRTPLMRAIDEDNFLMAEFLLEQGAGVNEFDQRGDTPLHKAVRRRNSELIRLLLEKGADPRIFNFTRMSPLHLAASDGHDDMVSIFLELPDMAGLHEEDSRTPLGYALKAHHYVTAELLIENGADIDRTHANGGTLLHDVLFARDYGVARFLIRAGADAHVLDAKGETAYDIMRRKQLHGLLDLVEEYAHSIPSAESTNTVEAAELFEEDAK